MEDTSWNRVIETLQQKLKEFQETILGKQQPFVTLTYAQSLDGSIAGKDNVQVTLSGNESMDMTHALRAHHDCILVGVGTVLNDNPSLTTRRVPGSNPQPIILDPLLRIPSSCKLLSSESTVRPIIVTADLADIRSDNEVVSPDQKRELSQDMQQRQTLVESMGATVWKCKGTPYRKPDDKGFISFLLDWTSVLRTVKEHNYSSIMVEGGRHLISHLLHLQHSESSPGSAAPVQLLVITIAPLFLGGMGLFRGSTSLGAGLRVANTKQLAVGCDTVVLGEFCSETIV